MSESGEGISPIQQTSRIDLDNKPKEPPINSKKNKKKEPVLNGLVVPRDPNIGSNVDIKV